MNLPATWTSDFPFHPFFFFFKEFNTSCWRVQLGKWPHNILFSNRISSIPSPMMLLEMGTNNGIYSGFLFSERMQGSSLEWSCLCKYTNDLNNWRAIPKTLVSHQLTFWHVLKYFFEWHRLEKSDLLYTEYIYIHI